MAALALCTAPRACVAQARSPNALVDPTVAKQMHDAVSAAQAGDEQRALATVDELLRQRPTFAPGLKLRGMLLEEMGRRPEAAQAYAAALKASPGDPDMLLKVGMIALVTAHYEQAVPLLERRVRAVPDDSEGNYYLAQAYHLEGQNDRALKAIEAALKAEPGSAPIQQKYGELLCSNGQSEEALKWLKKAQTAEPSLPRINFDLAVASYEGMDLEAAAGYASREAERSPGDLDDLRLLASVQVKLGEWQDAEINLRHVLAARADDAVAMLDLGHCELELKEYQAAVSTLQHALQLDPTLMLAHFYLSRAYGAQGNSAAAQHEAALHREMMQHNSLMLTKTEQKREQSVLNEAQRLLAAGDEAEALKLLGADERGPSTTTGSPWVSVGATYLAMNRPEDAQRALRHALELDPKTRDAHTYLGYMQLQQGNLSEAEREFSAELALDPNSSPALGELGEVRYRQQRWAEAVDLIVRSKTTNPLLLYMLCDAYFRIGKPEKAQLTAESLAAYGRGDAGILQALQELLRRNGQSALADKLASAS